MRAQLKGRLCLIEHCDFRCSEWTNLQNVLRKYKLALGKSDIVALVSGNGKQIVFCYAHDRFKYEDFRGYKKPTGVIQSVRYRITGHGTWSPTMLANYAEAAGIELVGIKRFEQYYSDIAAARVKARARK